MAKFVFTKKTKFNWANMPLLYIYVFQFIAEKLGGEKTGRFNQEISSKLILEVWHRHVYHVPRLYDFFFLEEMEYFGFIKRTHQQKYMFYGSLIDKAKVRLKSGVDESNKYQEAPLLYLYIFGRMIEAYGRENHILTGKQLINIWRRYIPNVSRVYDQHILTEMCNYGLIRSVDSQRYSQRYIFYGAKGFTKLRRITRLRLW